MEHAIIHAFATIIVPAALTLALVFWCTEFYRREMLRKPWYWALTAATAACVVVTALMFVETLGS